MNKVAFFVCLILDVALIPIKIPFIVLLNAFYLIYYRIKFDDTWKEASRSVGCIWELAWEMVVETYKDIWNGYCY